ncbi:hypothetical protein EI94DRAFT_1106909 [Lactarius quietus]|nr:hypothetical protein EI94DRAFT_1106909 [Lactarius quietus]
MCLNRTQNAAAVPVTWSTIIGRTLTRLILMFLLILVTSLQKQQGSTWRSTLPPMGGHIYLRYFCVVALISGRRNPSGTTAHRLSTKLQHVIDSSAIASSLMQVTGPGLCHNYVDTATQPTCSAIAPLISPRRPCLPTPL